MNKKVLKILNCIPFAVFFAAIFYFSRGVGLKGDDLRYILRSSYNFVLPAERLTTFGQSIESAFYDYMYQDARFISSVLCLNVLRFDLKVYQIVNPIVITLSFYLVLRIVNGNKSFDDYKNLFLNTVALMSFFSMTPSLLEDAVFWITGAVFYSWTMIAVVLVVKLLLDQPKKNTFNYVFWFIVSLRAGFATENMSLSLTVLSVIVVLYNCLYLKDKAYFSGVRRSTLISLWVFNAIEMIAPGSHSRADQLTGDLFNRALRGTTYFINSQYLAGGFIPLLLLVLLFMYVYRYSRKMAAAGALISIPLFVLSTINMTPPNNGLFIGHTNLSMFVEPNNVFYFSNEISSIKIIIILYYGLLTLAVAGIILYLLFTEKDQKMGILLILCTISNLAIMPLGGASERTAYFSQFFMIATSVHLSSLMFDNKKLVRLLAVFALLFAMMGTHKISYLSSNVAVNNIRESIFKNIKNGELPDTSITIPAYRFSIYGNFGGYYGFGDAVVEDYLCLDSEMYSLNVVPRSEFGIDW